MPVKTYHLTPLKFDAKLAVEVGQRRAGGESITAIAKALKMSAGKVAMAELVSATEVVTITDPALLARAIVKGRKAGASWGLLSARYLVSEGTCRAAYTAASGQPFTELDYRKAAKTQAKAKPASKPAAPKKAASPIKRGGTRQVARRIQEALDTQGVVIA